MSVVIAALGGLRATVFAALALALLVAAGVQTWRLGGAQDALAALQLAATRAEADAQRDAREQEREHAQQFAAIAGRLVTENENAEAEVDRLLAGLRDGTERLRRRFQCPAAPGVPGAAAGAGGGGEAAEAGFGAADAAVALRIARDGDDAIRQLSACQALLASERAGAG